jgi:hypothetical protein
MQMHLMDDREGPSILMLALICAVFGGITLVASFQTLDKLRNNKLSPADRARYKARPARACQPRCCCSSALLCTPSNVLLLPAVLPGP